MMLRGTAGAAIFGMREGDEIVQKKYGAQPDPLDAPRIIPMVQTTVSRSWEEKTNSSVA